jgi:putative phage-type endonuclease
MKILSLTQGSPEWHQHRRNSLGATSAPILAGCNPWRKPIDLYEEMVEGKPTVMNDSMRIGMAMEDEARRWAEEELECDLFPVTGEYDLFGYMHASYDGLSLDGSVAVEIKCSKKTYEDAKKGIIPIYYMFQMHQQMLIADLEFMYYVCYWNGKGDLMTVERDPKICSEIVTNAQNFYNNHILPKIPPSSDKTKKQPLNALEEDSRMSVLLNLANREEIVKKIKHLESLKTYLDEQIFNEVKESCEVGKWKITKSIVKGSVDWDKVCSDMKIDQYNLDSYRKPERIQWRITGGKDD